MENNTELILSEDLRNSSALEVAYANASSVLKREYLNSLTKYPVVPLSKEMPTDRDTWDYTRLYKITKLVYNKDESFLEKLTTIARAASIGNVSLVTIISSDGVNVSLLLGTVNKSYKKTMTNTTGDILKNSLSGSFCGLDIEKLRDEPVKDILSSFVDNEKFKVVSSISNVASLRDEDEDIKNYVQGIENLIEALQGKEYTIVTIADPISNQESSDVLSSLESLYTQLSVFEKTELAMNENASFSYSEQQSTSYSEAISRNISISQSHTTQTGWSESISKNESKTTNLGAGIAGGAAAVAAGITIASGGTGLPIAAIVAASGMIGGVLGGIVGSKTEGTTNSISRSGSQSDTVSRTESTGRTETIGQTNGITDTQSIGTGKSISFTVENKSVKNLLDNIDVQIERLKECASYGSFNACTYILTKVTDVNMIASGLFNALISGEKSNVQAAKVNMWGLNDGPDEEKKVLDILSYISNLTHPRFEIGNMVLTPSTLISGRELAIQLGVPKKSIQGLSVVYKVPFGRNVISFTKDRGKKLEIGKLYYMGATNKDTVALNMECFTSHVLITGSTGTGKTNVTCRILDSITDENPNVHFMVVEPAKGEYKHSFYNHPRLTGTNGVHVYGTNPKKMELLRINPFSFPDDIHVLEHVDRLVDILNVCWPMYAAMPAILKNAIIKSYEKCGWDIINSEYDWNKKIYPSFVDVLQCINEILESSAYSADSKGDYIGALCTRVEELTMGLDGQILVADEISAEELFDRNVIVDLSRVGSVDTKSLIMGILVMKLQEYRMTTDAIPNQPLKHVMVLEEAHNLLKKTSTEQTSESSNLTGKSVEMITNAIAEMRTYGEGFFIVDQAPSLLDEASVRNTNTKIVLRLPEAKDREVVGKSMALSDEQISELSKLDKGCAAVYQNDWEEAVLCQFEKYEKVKGHPEKNEELFEYNTTVHIETQSKIKKDVLKLLLDLAINEGEDINTDKVVVAEKLLLKLNVPFSMKVMIQRAMKSHNKYDLNDISGIVVELYDARKVVEKAKVSSDIETWNESILNMVDPELRKMSKNYMDVFVQCLLVEEAKKNKAYEDNVKFWKYKMREV